MARCLLKTLLVVGLFTGLFWGFCGMNHHPAWERHGHHRARFENHVADLCADAALRAVEKAGEESLTPKTKSTTGGPRSGDY